MPPLDVGDAPLDRLLEGAAFRANDVTSRADDEVGIENIARGDRRLELADCLIRGNAAASGPRAGFLGRLLVLDVHASGARTNELLDREMHVHGIPVAGVPV